MDGIWKAIHTVLREAVRRGVGRNPQPSAAIIDSQSIKTTHIGGPDRGFDGEKKVNGRKRHPVVNILGLILAVSAHAANIGDRDGSRLVLDGMPTRFPYLRKLWADSGYTGRFLTWAAAHLPWDVEIVKHWWTGRVFGWN